MDNPDIKPAVEQLASRGTTYKRFYDYYAGVHTLNFSSEKFKNKFGRQLQHLKENLCRTVVRAPASRLEAIGFTAGKEDIQNLAWDIWKRNQLPRNSGKVHRESFKTGDAYVIVWPDPIAGKAKIYPQMAGSMTVWRNADTGEIEKAAKIWTGADKKAYLNLYYPDRIEKYISKNESLSPNVGDTEFLKREVAGEIWPLPNPYDTVPVFHFRTDEELQEFGTSILTDVIPLNDALNKSYCDIFAAQEVNAIRQRWISGMQFEKDDETGKAIIPYDFDSQAWTSPEADTKFGEFSDAQLEQMIAVKQMCVADIALVSGIPPSYFNLEQVGQAISGEALRKLEARFTAIVQDAQRSFGETWSEAMRLALRIESRSDSDTMGEIEVQWTDASPIGDGETLDNLIKKQTLGWSPEQIQRDYGLTDKQITDMAKENSDRQESQMEATARFMDSGLKPPLG